MIELISFITLLLIGVFFGGMNERNHFRRLDAEEAELAHIKVVNLKRLPDDLQRSAVMVTGNVVIAVDYFKRIAGFFRLLFGGEMKSYQSLMTRARREAVLRMKREAAELGADMVYNVRIEFSVVGAQPRSGGAELLAYGTAVKFSG